MSSELILILLVALLVFGPNKLPMLAMHLGLVIRKLNQYKQHVSLYWERQLQEAQLQANKRKAEEADEQYKS